MVERTEREMELIEKREAHDKEQAEDREKPQQRREKMIIKKFKSLHGKDPTKEEIKSDSDYIDRVLHKLKFPAKRGYEVKCTE